MSFHVHNWILLAYAVGSFALVVANVVVLRRGRRVGVTASVLVLLVTIGLAYDNTLLAFGSSWGESRALELASYPRYLMHALFTPLLVLFAALTARRWDVRGFRTSRSLGIWTLITVAIILGGLAGEIDMHLSPVTTDGVLSYKHLDGAPPYPEIATVVALIIIGIAVLRHARWLWILVGAAQMFVCAAVAAAHSVVTNAGELLLLAAMTATAHEVVRRLAPQTRPSASTPDLSPHHAVRSSSTNRTNGTRSPTSYGIGASSRSS